MSTCQPLRWQPQDGIVCNQHAPRQGAATRRQGTPVPESAAVGPWVPEGREPPPRLLRSPPLPSQGPSPESYTTQRVHEHVLGKEKGERCTELSLPSASSPRQAGTLPSLYLPALWTTPVSPGPPPRGASQLSGNFWPSLAPLTCPAQQRATYSASWSWGSARPRCRRSRGCGRRCCQSTRFLWEAHR